jgi:hypothetical protein
METLEPREFRTYVPVEFTIKTILWIVYKMLMIEIVFRISSLAQRERPFLTIVEWNADQFKSSS